MTTRLQNLFVGEVSLVDKAANKKRFYLTKAADPKTEPEKVETPAATPEPSLIEKALAEAVDGDAPDADPTKDLTVALRRVAKASGLDEAGLKAALGIKDPEPVVKAAEPAADPLADLPPEAKAKVEALFKAQADAIAKAEALSKTLDEEREAKAVTESIQKAAVDFKHLPEKADAIGPALRALRKADAKALDVLENVLKRADSLVAQALDPKGVSAAVTSEASGLSTYERVQKRAQSLVEKGEVKTIADGVSKIFEAEPELYAAHEAEKKG
jgi:hypothetical protein